MSRSGLVLVQVGEGGGAWRVQRYTGNVSVGSKVTLWACWTVGPGSLGMGSSRLVLDPETRFKKDLELSCIFKTSMT